MTNFFYTLIVYPLTQIIEFAFVFAQKIFKETGISLIFYQRRDKRLVSSVV
jgi:hypothetical protein